MSRYALLALAILATRALAGPRLPEAIGEKRRMKNIAFATVALLAIASTGCSTPPIVGGDGAKEVVIDGLKVWVTPMPDKNAWGATRYAVRTLIEPNPATETAFLVKAIETVSGCKVAHYHYEPPMQNLYAAVNCRDAENTRPELHKEP